MRRALAALAAVAVTLAAAPAAAADPPLSAVGHEISGVGPDGLGHWVVRYQRLAGSGPIIDRINEVIDAEARGQVSTYDASASKTTDWTLDIDGVLGFRPVTVSALFTGLYDTDLPNMPFHTVGTRVFDTRSGILISWDNLFVNKQEGLNRLSEATREILPQTYAPPSRTGVWQFGSEIAPVDANYRYWIPTDGGIELHFADWQFGRGQSWITVPWERVRDLIAPEFQAII
ncbi:DUF3298 domain-containing protein [Mycolicibacterium brumae]|uniref:DUF3298 domain-containing protein n=1 Tax=Mycolicibacterium brumae TaxID=85968 RepID=UPI000A5379CA|nr:DUF3298 domain-containing protein [Mycolicibacterium brumae]RWA20117.1 hypothetical protein MBRU_15905 [Mycolicibacterium brumae DSM 44177]UWW10045.1 DUF3298 domain-containing protein [Mycolicibacterium brumae]